MAHYKVIVAGSRSFSNYDQVKRILDSYKHDGNTIDVISGTAEGADKLGEKYSREELGREAIKFPAKWNDLSAPNAIIKTNSYGKKYNARAGLDRNEEMAKIADHCIVFWDGKSKGTKHMISMAELYNLYLTIL